MSEKVLLKKIKNLQKIQKIESKARLILSQKFLDETEMLDVAWDQGKLILSDIIGKDFDQFYKDLAKPTKTNPRGKGWISEGFAPDEMMNIIANSQESPKRVLSQIKTLYKKVS